MSYGKMWPGPLVHRDSRERWAVRVERAVPAGSALSAPESTCTLRALASKSELDAYEH